VKASSKTPLNCALGISVVVTNQGTINCGRDTSNYAEIRCKTVARSSDKQQHSFKKVLCINLQMLLKSIVYHRYMIGMISIVMLVPWFGQNLIVETSQTTMESIMGATYGIG
jgi:hypothetical protein